MTTPQQRRPAPHPQRRPPAPYGPPPPRPMAQPPAPRPAGPPPDMTFYGPPAQYPPQPAPQVMQPAPQVVHVANMPRKSVTKERKRTSHGLHLVLTICTGGAWGLFVWLPLTMWHRFGPKRKVITKHR